MAFWCAFRWRCKQSWSARAWMRPSGWKQQNFQVSDCAALNENFQNFRKYLPRNFSWIRRARHVYLPVISWKVRACWFSQKSLVRLKSRKHERPRQLGRKGWQKNPSLGSFACFSAFLISMTDVRTRFIFCLTTFEIRNSARIDLPSRPPRSKRVRWDPKDAQANVRLAQGVHHSLRLEWRFAHGSFFVCETCQPFWHSKCHKPTTCLYHSLPDASPSFALDGRLEKAKHARIKDNDVTHIWDHNEVPKEY